MVCGWLTCGEAADCTVEVSCSVCWNSVGAAWAVVVLPVSFAGAISNCASSGSCGVCAAVIATGCWLCGADWFCWKACPASCGLPPESCCCAFPGFWFSTESTALPQSPVRLFACGSAAGCVSLLAADAVAGIGSVVAAATGTVVAAVIAVFTVASTAALTVAFTVFTVTACFTACPPDNIAKSC